MKKNITFILASIFLFSINTNGYASTQANKKSLCEQYRQIAKENCKKGFLGLRDGRAGACFGAQIMVAAKGC
ncbi:heat-stable enterotoxin ST-II [Escherichia coli]